MDHLPIELLQFIFRHLDLYDLLNCRLVNKKWKFFIDETKIDELILNDKVEDYENYWFHTRKGLNYKNAIKLDQLCALKAIFFKLEHSLKCLHINEMRRDYESIDNFEFINSFSKLEQLDIAGLVTYLGDSFHLNLPNLKIFQINNIDYDDEGETFEPIVLNTPKLEVLKCEQFDYIDVAYPHAIKNLQVKRYIRKCDRFNNLEYFTCSTDLNRDVLSIFRNLKELNLYSDFLNDYDAFKNTLLYINRQKQTLRRDEFKIYLIGVQLKGAGELMA